MSDQPKKELMIFTSMAEYKDYLEKELAVVNTRLTLFENCLDRALKLWQKEHPDAEGWPDGAVNLAWLLDQVTWKKVADQKPKHHENVILKIGEDRYESMVFFDGDRPRFDDGEYGYWLEEAIEFKFEWRPIL